MFALAPWERSMTYGDAAVSEALRKEEVLQSFFARAQALLKKFGHSAAGAPAGVDGVFHPPYIETHLAVAERLARPRLLVLKGGGGEAERYPGKPVTVHLWSNADGRHERVLPALAFAADTTEPDLAALWRGEIKSPATEARIVATIALGLIALGQGADQEAQTCWTARPRPTRSHPVAAIQPDMLPPNHNQGSA